MSQKRNRKTHTPEVLCIDLNGKECIAIWGCQTREVEKIQKRIRHVIRRRGSRHASDGTLAKEIMHEVAMVMKDSGPERRWTWAKGEVISLED